MVEEGGSAMDLILRGLQYAAPAGFEGRENLKWVTSLNMVATFTI